MSHSDPADGGSTSTSKVLFIILGIVLLAVVAYKPIYDARESSEVEPTWQACHVEMVGVVPGLILAFLETLLLASISVAISTRLLVPTGGAVVLAVSLIFFLTLAIGSWRREA